MSDPRPSTLYLCRNGLLEPLGQSQVLAYQKGLATDHRVTVISFEKPEDLADTQSLEALQRDCAALGIRWLPQTFRRGPRGLTQALDLWRFFVLTRREVRAGNAQLIHARSYIPAFIAMLVGWLYHTPFIFDMRALWPEEMITAGRLRRGSAIHRAIAWAERVCIKRAAVVVSLTHAGAAHLKQLYAAELAGREIAVIPTCADLEHFRPAADPDGSDRPAVYSCIGTVLSGWFRMDALAALFNALAARDPDASFEVITRDNPDQVRQALAAAGFSGAQLSIYGLSRDQMPQALQGQRASVMLYAGGELSELGRSPTRLAELLGCGVPVFANSGVGDVAQVVRDNRVGVLVDDLSAAGLNQALEQMQQLLRDRDLPRRCRATAQNLFSLEAGTQAYRGLYAQILAQGAGE